MKVYKYIAFDLDGTLTDPEAGLTAGFAYALSKMGIDYGERKNLTRFIGPPLKDSFMKFYGFNEEKAEEAVEKYREYFRPYGVYENTVYEGIPELLSALHEKGKKKSEETRQFL